MKYVVLFWMLLFSLTGWSDPKILNIKKGWKVLSLRQQKDHLIGVIGNTGQGKLILQLFRLSMDDKHEVSFARPLIKTPFKPSIEGLMPKKLVTTWDQDGSLWIAGYTADYSIVVLRVIPKSLEVKFYKLDRAFYTQIDGEFWIELIRIAGQKLFLLGQDHISGAGIIGKGVVFELSPDSKKHRMHAKRLSLKYKLFEKGGELYSWTVKDVISKDKQIAFCGKLLNMEGDNHLREYLMFSLRGQTMCPVHKWYGSGGGTAGFRWYKNGYELVSFFTKRAVFFKIMPDKVIKLAIRLPWRWYINGIWEDVDGMWIKKSSLFVISGTNRIGLCDVDFAKRRVDCTYTKLHKNRIKGLAGVIQYNNNLYIGANGNDGAYVIIIRNKNEN